MIKTKIKAASKSNKHKNPRIMNKIAHQGTPEESSSSPKSRVPALLPPPRPDQSGPPPLIIPASVSKLDVEVSWSPLMMEDDDSRVASSMSVQSLVGLPFIRH